MIIYNVTVNVDESIHNDWLNWMQNKHINDVLATGLFTNAKMVRVVVEEEMGGTTYAVQYFTDSRAKLEDYYQNHAPRLRKEGVQLFADKMLAFRTELEVISEFYGKTN
jgi:hypothetical protein